MYSLLLEQYIRDHHQVPLSLAALVAISMEHALVQEHFVCLYQRGLGD
jgi:hypothetical protein